MDEGGIRGSFFLSILFVCVCYCYVALLFSSFKLKVSSCVVFSLLQHLAPNKKDNTAHTHTQRQEKEKNIRGENYVNNPQGPVVNSRVTRLLLVMVYSFTTTTYSFFFSPPVSTHAYTRTNK